MIPSSISCIWHVGPRVEWRIAHSPLIACSSGTNGWSGMTSDRLVFSVGWEMDPNTWDLALRPINFIPKVNNLTSNILNQYGASFILWVALLGRKAMYLWFLLCPKACRAHLGASSVVRIEWLGCSKLGSLQLSPPLKKLILKLSRGSIRELHLERLWGFLLWIGASFPFF